MQFSKADILALDPSLFSLEDKSALIRHLYGDAKEWTWKSDLQTKLRFAWRWEELKSSAEPKGKPFYVNFDQLCLAAKKNPPGVFSPTVSAFTDWIFRLYFPPKENVSLRNGKLVEREIARRHIPLLTHDRWKLIHDGRGDGSDDGMNISPLAIKNTLMRGSPDLVLREKRTGKILIVELKATNREAPTDGWPNLQAQLWAYSQIDAFQDAPEIILAGEIWGFALPRLTWKRTVRWKKGDVALEQRCTLLFNIYKSHIESARNS